MKATICITFSRCLDDVQSMQELNKLEDKQEALSYRLAQGTKKNVTRMFVYHV